MANIYGVGLLNHKEKLNHISRKLDRIETIIFDKKVRSKKTLCIPLFVDPRFSIYLKEMGGKDIQGMVLGRQGKHST